MSIAIRVELTHPGLQIFRNEPHTFNVFVTAHGLTMILFRRSCQR